MSATEPLPPAPVLSAEYVVVIGPLRQPNWNCYQGLVVRGDQVVWEGQHWYIPRQAYDEAAARIDGSGCA